MGTPGVKLFEGMCPHPDLIIDDWLCFIFYNCKSVYHPECSWFLGVDFTKARHSSVFFTNDYSVRHFQVVDWTNFLYLPLSLTLVVTTVASLFQCVGEPGLESSYLFQSKAKKYPDLEHIWSHCALITACEVRTVWSVFCSKVPGWEIIMSGVKQGNFLNWRDLKKCLNLKIIFTLFLTW